MPLKFTILYTQNTKYVYNEYINKRNIKGLKMLTLTKNDLPKLLDEGRLFFPAFRLNIVIIGYTGKNMPELATWQNIVIRGKYAHLITINMLEMENDKDLFEAILHELVHAWQYEKNPKITDHNAEFLTWVVFFGKLGYNISCADFTLEQLETAFTTKKVA